jgi:CRAL/TRIO domain
VVAEGVADAASLTTRTIQLSEEEAEQCARFEKLIEDDLHIQKMAVRGYDKENRAIIVKLCREAQWSGSETADEAFYLAQLYIAERAIAATELRSIGKKEQLTAIFDFSTYDAANKPPVTVIVHTLKILQANYPERLGKAIALDAPFFMQAVIAVVNPLLAAKTRDKLAILGSSSLQLPKLWPLRGTSPSPAEVREETVRAVLDPDQAMPFMLPDAKLISAIDVVRQLRQVPFYELYDYATPDSVTAVS